LAASFTNHAASGTAQRALARIARHRVWPPVNADATLRRLDQILNHPNVKAAQT
jgi:hypothetical protein